MSTHNEFEIDERLASFVLDAIDSGGEQLMPTEVIVVAQFLDEDGDERWAAMSAGNGRIASAIGLLEFGKAWALEQMVQQSGGSLS